MIQVNPPWRSIAKEDADRTYAWSFMAAVIVFLLASVSFILYSGGYDRLVSNQLPDATDYVGVSVSLLAHGRYGAPVLKHPREKTLYEELQDGIPDVIRVERTSWRPPLWPLAMAPALAIGNGSFFALLILKYLLAIGSLALLSVLMRDLGVRGVLLWLVMLVAAASPGLLIYSHQMMSETLTLFLITAFSVLLFRIVDQRIAPRGYAVIAGIVGGLLILSHPYYLLLPFVSCMIVLVHCGKIRTVVVVAGVTCLVVSVWIVRNAVVYDGRILLTTSTGAALAKGWNSELLSKFTNTQGDLANEAVDVPRYFPEAYPKNMNEVDRSDLYVQTVRAYVSEHWRSVIPIAVRKITSGINPIHETERGGILETGRMLFSALFLIPLIFLRRLYRSNKMYAMVYVGAIVSYFAMGLLTYTGLRFRFPISFIELTAVALIVQSLVERRDVSSTMQRHVQQQ